jgi:predicted ester cyclase
VRFYRPFETGDTRSHTTILRDDWLDAPLSPGQGAGRAGFASVIAGYHSALPDLRVHIEEVLVSGDTVTVRTSATGTQRGPLLGVAPTGRRVTFGTTDIHHFRGPLIASTNHLEDLFGLYSQITAP